MTRRFAAASTVLAASSLLACTDTGIHRDPPKVDPPPIETFQIEGSFCTEDPETVSFPVKVWFVIDDSGSMGDADPNMVRYSATQELATALEDTAPPPSMFFGGEIFSGGEAVRFSQPDRFTASAATFNANVAAVANAGGGGTPYVAALGLTVAELTADIAEDPVIAKRTRYVVIFLSDGAPSDSDGPDFPEVRAGIEALLALRSDAGDVTLNTVYLGGDGDEAEMVLQAMSQAGGGIHKSFPGGDDLDYSDFDFSAIRRNYNQRFFIATNLSAMPSKNGHFPDSDMDGFTDLKEAELGTNPLLRDSDADGCSDLMEVRDAGWDPLVPGTQNNECSCNENERTADGDKDGLTDCEEKWLAADPVSADGDRNEDDVAIGDLVPDGLDYTYLGDVNFPNDGMDYDADGIQDLAELRVHTDPRAADADRDHWAYQYVLLDQQPDEPRCFDFRIENVSLMSTLEEGKMNHFLLYFAQSPQDNAQKEKSFRAARIDVPYSTSGTLRVEPEEFDEVLVVADPTATPP